MRRGLSKLINLVLQLVLAITLIVCPVLIYNNLDDSSYNAIRGQVARLSLSPYAEKQIWPRMHTDENGAAFIRVHLCPSVANNVFVCAH
jgi:hypothetical protein